jgi:hypothetical protein
LYYNGIAVISLLHMNSVIWFGCCLFLLCWFVFGLVGFVCFVLGRVVCRLGGVRDKLRSVRDKTARAIWLQIARTRA